MANTVIGLFDNVEDARRASQRLIENGFTREEVDLTTADAGGDYADGEASRADARHSDEGFGDKVGNFFNKLFGDGYDAESYTDAMRHGSTLVVVHARSSELAARAAGLLDESGAIDVEERVAQYRATGAGGAGGELREREAVIPVVEEELHVGKREVERGGVRVRSRIVERPVEESVRLREERVRVDRRPVDRPATAADLNTAEGAFEVTERAEEAVVAKQARVVEEVAVNKQVEERQETVRDTVRRTDVDVEEIDGGDIGRARGTGR